MAQLAECLGAELPVDDMRCGLQLVHRRPPEPTVGMLLQISIQEKGVHGQQAVQEWAVFAGTSARRHPIFFANGVPRRASISASTSSPAASSGVLKAGCCCIHCQPDSGNGQIRFPVPSYKICNIAYIPFPKQVLCMTGNEGTSMLPFPVRLAAE